MEKGRSKEARAGKTKKGDSKKLEDLIAAAESSAFGFCGITPDQFNRYSIAEIHAIILARAEVIDRSERLKDIMNAKLCHAVAISGHLTIDDKSPKLADFLTLPRETDKNKEEEITPEQYMETLELIAKTYKPPEEG